MPPPRPLRLLGMALATTAMVATAVAADAAPRGAASDRASSGRPVAGADGIGDPYFPLAGNGGIDVVHYDLELDYTPPGPAPAPLEGTLDASATIELEATANLASFNLDLRGLTADRVRIDGRRTPFDQVDNELVVSARPPLRTGDTVTVEIDYGGTTTRPRDIENALYGFVTTRDGAMVVSEPDGAATWFPVNDHPLDKATYAFEITVPEGLVAVANGELVGESTTAGRTTWTWDAPDPMAAYLATATIGNFELVSSTAPNGVEILDAIDRDLAPSASADLALTGDMLVFFADLYGEYPFVNYGAIVDDDSVGYALETQTRSFFSRNAREGTIAHELAHQWMGDHVGPSQWSDIWLNEGWATYSSWLWSEDQGRTTAQQSYESVLGIAADSSYWTIVVSDPGPFGLFSSPVYTRGAATLHALRLEIGDDAFFDLAREWVARYGGATGSTDDFRSLAEEVSGQDLDSLFDAWLDAQVRPTTW